MESLLARGWSQMQGTLFISGSGPSPLLSSHLPPEVSALLGCFGPCACPAVLPGQGGAPPPSALCPVISEAARLTQIQACPQISNVSGIKGPWGLFISEVPWLLFVLLIPARVEGRWAALRAPMSSLVTMTLCLLPLVLQLLSPRATAEQGEWPLARLPSQPQPYHRL